MQFESSIKIINTWEGNLKNISLEIPKNQLVVFTGLSGSGKSTLLVDVLFQECQRKYLEAMGMEGIQKPKLEQMKGASPALFISQTDMNRNPRSTVGTLTDVYTDLRMIYEKLGVRTCPHCGERISAAHCKEEIEKDGKDFHVFMYCNKCGKRMDKFTCSYFSFNTKEGACPTCQGLGQIHSIRREAVVNDSLSLQEGAVTYWEKQYGEYQLSVLKKAFAYYGLLWKEDKPVKEYSPIEKAILYDGVMCEEVQNVFHDKQAPTGASSGKFEGVFPILWRRYAEKKGKGEKSGLEPYFESILCPDCQGDRLAKQIREVTVKGEALSALSHFSLEKLLEWIKALRSSLTSREKALIEVYLLDIETKLRRYLQVGLNYLTLDRPINTLSGGEMQRLRLSASLDSDLSGIIYILDEPTAGLHQRDTAGLIKILNELRDLGNTVLVIEHDPDVMQAADYIIDMGPGAGKLGGRIVAAGSLAEIKETEGSATGLFLRCPPDRKNHFRKAESFIEIEEADRYNLKDISVKIPVGCFTSVIGPSGSGKSTLIMEILAKGNSVGKKNRVKGLEQFDGIVEIGQKAISKMRRSNVATYADVYTEIRKVFAKTDGAKKRELTARDFSFNSPGGRCENCQGLGYVENHLLFFSNTEIVCPVCNGNRFENKVLEVELGGMNLKEVLDLSVCEGLEFFRGYSKIAKILSLLCDVGLGYLILGQSLTTLSGGECQRLKLAKELIANGENKRYLYLLDEPSVGLHPKDVADFLILLNRFADSGNTVIVVEHNEQMIGSSDWLIELGPSGGEKGGLVIFQGTAAEYFGNLTER